MSMWEPFEEYAEDFAQSPVRGQTWGQHMRLAALCERCRIEAERERTEAAKAENIAAILKRIREGASKRG